MKSSSPEAALRLLNTYQADPANDNPDGRESEEVDRMISHRELAMVRLIGPTASLAPNDVYHCDALDPRNLECKGVYMDGTGHPNATAMLPPATTKAFSARVDNKLPGGRLQGLYRTTLDDVQVGRPPVKLSIAGPVTITPSGYRRVVIAIISGPGRNQIRKFVWYP